MTSKSENSKTITIQLRVEPSHAKAIDEWRRMQIDIPGRSEAIRRLTLIALGKAAKPKSK